MKTNRLATCEKALDVALDNLLDMVDQHCSTGDGGFEYDSMALSANAAAMRTLAEYGRIEIVSEYGRRVIARAVEKKEESNERS